MTETKTTVQPFQSELVEEARKHYMRGLLLLHLVGDTLAARGDAPEREYFDMGFELLGKSMREMEEEISQLRKIIDGLRNKGKK